MGNIGRRAQEEIAGFVAVVVVVAVMFIAVMGLLFFSAKQQSTSDSPELKQFLESMMQTGSSCALDFEPAYSSIGELFIACFQTPERICKLSQKNACQILNKTLNEAIESSWDIGENKSFAGYRISAQHQSKANQTKQFLDIEKGSCRRNFIAEEYLLPERQTRGTIIVSMRLCT